MATGIFKDNSPVALFIGICKKYGLLGFIKQCIISGEIPGKMEWKRMCNNAMRDHEFARWRLDLKLYRKLDIFRVVHLKIEPSVWWTVTRNNVRLNSSCCTMLRLLAGCNQLRTNMDTHIPYNERICIYCDNDCVEDQVSE